MKFLRELRANVAGAKRVAGGIDVSKWRKLCIMIDALWCKLWLHCAFEEYRVYEFYKYKNAYRKTFILMSHKATEFRKINPRRFTMHKKVFYELIHRSIRREWICLPEAGEEQFLAFVKKHHKVLTKPDVGSHGKNIQIFEYTNDEQALAFFRSIQEDTLCEEYIRQHEKMASLNPSSVNSIRVVTLCDDGKVRFISASLRSGGHSKAIVDNMCNNGVGANVDLQTGVVTSLGQDYHDHTYIYHPVTGTQIVGFAVPRWQEAVELVRQTHLDIPQCPLIGWDVAITADGPEVIEINSGPGCMIMQRFDQKPKRKYIQAYIKKHNLNKLHTMEQE